MPGNRHTRLCCLEGSTPEERGRFILVYRLAMDAKTRKGDDVAD